MGDFCDFGGPRRQLGSCTLFFFGVGRFASGWWDDYFCHKGVACLFTLDFFSAAVTELSMMSRTMVVVRL